MKELWESAWRKASSLSKLFFQTDSVKESERSSVFAPTPSDSSEHDSETIDLSLQDKASFNEDSAVYVSGDSRIKLVDFSAPQDCNGSSPLYCTIKDEKLHFPKKSWASLVTTFIEKLLAEKHPGLQSLYKPSANSRRAILLSHPLSKPRQFQLSNGSWINLYFNAGNHVRILKRLCESCDIPLGSVLIGYEPLDKSRLQNKAKESAAKKTKAETKEDKQEAIAEAFRKELARYEEKQQSQRKEDIVTPASHTPHEEAEPYKEQPKLSSPIPAPPAEAIAVSEDECEVTDKPTNEITDHKNDVIKTTPPDTWKNLYPDATLLNFKHSKSTRFTKPVACHLRGEKLSFEDNSWASLFFNLVEQVIKEDHPQLKSLNYISLKGKYPFFLAKQRNDHYRLLSNGKWLHVNYSSTSIVRLIRYLFLHCSLNIDDIQIWYTSIQNEKQTTQSPEPLTVSDDGPQQQILNFSVLETVKHSYPVACSLRGVPLTLQENTWPQVLIALTEQLIKEELPELASLSTVSLMGANAFFLPQKQFSKQVRLSNGKWLNVSYNDRRIVRLIKRLCKYCNIPLKELQIWYQSHDMKEALSHADSSSHLPADISDLNLLDLDDPCDVTLEEPVELYVYGKKILLADHSWVGLYIALVEHLIEEKNPELGNLEQEAFREKDRLLNSQKTEIHQRLLSNGKWLALSYKPIDTINMIRRLCYHCGIDPDDLQIWYQPRDNSMSLTHIEASAESQTSLRNVQLLDFDHPRRTAYTKPVACHFGSEELTLKDKTWACLFTTVVERLIEDNHPRLASLNCTPLKGKRPFFLPEKSDKQQRHLSNGKWLDIRLSAPDTIRQIKRLLKHCNLDVEKLRIEYQPRAGSQAPPLSKVPDLPPNPEGLEVLDFNDPDSVVYTSPVSFHIFGKELPLKKQHWAQVLIALVEYLIDRKYSELETLEEIPLRGKELLFESHQTKRHRHRLSNGKWLHLHNGAIGMVIMVRRLCEYCNISIDNIEIQYMRSDKSGSTSKEKQDNASLSAAIPAVEVPPELKEALCKILSEKDFFGGFRINSVVECMRFRKIAQSLGITILPEDNSALDAAIIACGVLFNKKVFLIPQEVTDWLLESFTQAQKEGVGLIYYSTFYNFHEDWLHQRRVHGSAFLKQMLCELSLPKKVFFKNKYCSLQGKRSNERPALRNEILRIWKEGEQILTYEEIQQRLPYVPLKKIKECLGSQKQFIWVKKHHYTHQSRVLMSEEDITTLQKYVQKHCQHNQFISVKDLPLEKMREENDSLSQVALEMAAFQIALSKDFKKDGSIISPKDVKLNTTVLLTELCCARSECSLKELISYYRELTGTQRHYSILAIAHSVKIRIDEDTFIAEDRIYFDVGQIDSILDRLITGDFIPLQAVKTFTGFPACGSPWNLFLLESYCNRFSEHFRYDVLAFNSANAGAIVRKSAPLSYREVMAHALAQADVILEKKTALDYLFERGYLGKRSFKKINTLLKDARQLRQKRR